MERAQRRGGPSDSPGPGDLTGAVRRLDAVELCRQVFVLRRAADNLGGTPAPAVFAALRDLIEAEERRRDEAGWAYVQRAERWARAECEALGVRF